MQSRHTSYRGLDNGWESIEGETFCQKHAGLFDTFKSYVYFFKIKVVFFKIKVVLFFNYLNNIFPGTFLLSYSYSYQSYRSLFCLRSLVHSGWRAFYRSVVRTSFHSSIDVLHKLRLNLTNITLYIMAESRYVSRQRIFWHECEACEELRYSKRLQSKVIMKD